MKRCTKCGTEKQFFEFSRSSKTKDGLQYHCKACKLAYQKANPRRSDSVKRYYEANREVCIARSIASQAKKREMYNQKMRDWVAANREKHLERRRNYYARNAASDIERVRRRQNRIKGADNLTKAEKAEIDGLYMFCRLFSGFEVDHIVPLNGKTVSGLHVPKNLQVLPIKENRKKGNKFTESDYAQHGKG